MAASNAPQTSNMKPFTGQAQIIEIRDYSAYINLHRTQPNEKDATVQVHPKKLAGALERAREGRYRLYNFALGIDSGEITPPPPKAEPISRKGTIIYVINLATGQGFAGTVAAALAANVTSEGVYQSARNGQRTLGHRFRFATKEEEELIKADPDWRAEVIMSTPKAELSEL